MGSDATCSQLVLAKCRDETAGRVRCSYGTSLDTSIWIEEVFGSDQAEVRKRCSCYFPKPEARFPFIPEVDTTQLNSTQLNHSTMASVHDHFDIRGECART